MKKSILAAALAVLLSLSATACFDTSDSPVSDTSTGEAVTLPPVTLPDLTDDRVLTDTAPYTERLESLFAETPTAPTAHFTYEITEEGTVTLTGYTGGELAVVIPEAIEDKPVAAIAPEAFKGMATLKAVSVPDTVTEIGAGAFAGCVSLTSLRTPVITCKDAPFFGALFGAASHEAGGGAVPTELTTLVLTQGSTIPDYAFYACRGLQAVSLPATVTAIGDFAFYGCSGLALITTAQASLISVGTKAFANCSALLELTLPATVTAMGIGILEGCGALESLTVPFAGGTADPAASEEGSASTAYLGYLFGATSYTFTAGYLPASLMTVTLTEGCTAIPDNAFFECASIREVNIPEGVTSIGRRAFYGCDRLTAVTLPDTVTSIGDDAFNGCIRLTTFTGGRGLTTLGVQCFMNCLSLTAVTLPDGVTHLPNSCFSGCQSLESLKADGVKTQGRQVFRHCDKIAKSGWGIPVSPTPEN